jgi:hypothetical protein
MFLKQILAILLFFSSAFAADIKHFGDGVMLISGDIVSSDSSKFINIALQLDKGVVVLTSGGGSLDDGLEIGKAIRMKGFATYVPAGQVCASVCALIWLAGTPRCMSARARIGFHAVYFSGSGQVASGGNALVGSYLSKLNLSEAAIYRLTEAGPREMSWGSPAGFNRLGIEVCVKELDETPQPALPPSATLEPPPAQDTNIPDTSSHDIKSAAEDFVRRYLSGFAAETVMWAFADQVSYYGQQKSRREVLTDHAEFVKRWPVRRYWAQQMTVNCEATGKCVIDAVIGWDNSSQPRNARSTGTSTLYLVIRKTDSDFVIEVVNGEVKSRLVSKLTPQPCLFGVLCLNEGN